MSGRSWKWWREVKAAGGSWWQFINGNCVTPGERVQFFKDLENWRKQSKKPPAKRH